MPPNCDQALFFDFPQSPTSPSLNGIKIGNLLPPQLPEDNGKLTVVLDIDETLIHSEFLRNPQELEQKDVFVLDMGNEVKIKVQKRPFLYEFLEAASAQFELIAFTAGAEDYAVPLLNALDPKGTIFRHKLYRSHCLEGPGGIYSKDLRVCNRDMRRIVLVDNNNHSFIHQLQNGIPIVSFFNDMNDQALIPLFEFLSHVSQQEDVRVLLRQIFRLEALFGTSITPT